MKPLTPALLSALLASCSFDTGGHARIHRLFSTRQALAACATPAASAAPLCLPMSHPGNVHQHASILPADHAAFTCMPGYPRTFRVWKDEAKMRAEGPRHVEIDLARQRGIFVVNDEVAMDFPVCTGTKRKPTPTGHFCITQKNVRHHSNIYDVPMPYFMRLTNGGIGMHVGDVFRAPASHGCIRLTREACVPLFHHAPSGTRVVIRRNGWTQERPQAPQTPSQAPSEPLPPPHAPQLARAAG